MGCARFQPQKMVFRSNQGGQLWRSSFTGRTLPCSGNVSLNRTDDAERQVLLKLLADEEAKDASGKKEN